MPTEFDPEELINMIMELLPEASFTYDPFGQLIIQTRLKAKNGKYVAEKKFAMNPILCHHCVTMEDKFTFTPPL